MSTRNRLTNEFSMPNQNKSGVDVRQAERVVSACSSRPVSWCAPRPVETTVSRWWANRSGSLSSAAFCRRTLVILLFLSACGFNTPRVFADTPNEAPGSSRTEDHVHVTARRAGDDLLITLRIDPGYHINANPASDDYLIPTGVAFAGFAPERIIYPRAIPFKPAFADKPIDVYEGTVVVVAAFPVGALDRTHDLGFTVTAQACKKVICLPPNDIAACVTW